MEAQDGHIIPTKEIDVEGCHQPSLPAQASLGQREGQQERGETEKSLRAHPRKQGSLSGSKLGNQAISHPVLGNWELSPLF